MRTVSTNLSLLMFFFCMMCFSAAFSQGTISIKGTVTDESGSPLSGVSINVKGSSTNALTTTQGTYTISTSDKKAVLVFSFVGLATQEITVGNKTTINVSMVAASKQMDEVVVTALNMKRNAKSLGYSVATIDGSAVNTVQTPSIVSALSGKVAGVDVSNIANGVAGTKRIIIRGASSLTGNNQPLWVVDGVPINSGTLGGMASNAPEGGVDYGDGLGIINPDDIETISVLKGNAAAALYGSLASNGVILVTTKSGKSSKGRTNVDFSSSLMIDKLVNPTDFQYVYGQSGLGDQPPQTPNEAFSSSSWGAKFDGSPSMQFDGVIRPFSPVRNNYEKFFNTGSTITNTVSLSGSNEKHNYRISLSDLRNADIVPNAKYNRTIVNTKTSSKFGKLTVDLVLNYNFEKANNRPFIGGNVSNLFYSLVYMPGSIDVDNLKPGYNPDGSEFSYANSISNPWYVVNKVKQFDTKHRTMGSLSLQYDITNWLYARGRVTRDFYNSYRQRYTPEGNQFTSYPLGQFEERAIQSVVENYEFILGLKPVNMGRFSVNAFAGLNRLDRSRDEVNTSGNSFIVPGIYTFNNLATKLPVTTRSLQRTNSVFGSMELAYNKYLFLTLTGRNDWFSTLPLENNNLFYPAASLSFVFSDAFKLPAFISYGKVRASTAQVSGDTDPYQLDLSYSLTQVSYGNLPLQYVGTTNIPNKLLKPLLSTDYEFGLDMEFFNRRLGFDFSYYDRQTKDDIVRTAVSYSTGYRTAILNVGRLRNKGVELLLRATPVRTKNFTWNSTFTFSYNDNKVIALGDGAGGEQGPPILLATAKSGEAIIQLEEGKRYGSIYGYKFVRGANGDIMYDSRGYPMYTTKNEYLGNGVFDKLFGFSNTFQYKGFSFYTLLDAKFGASIYSETNSIAYENGRHKATLLGREDGLIGEGVDQNGNKNTVLVAGKNTVNPAPGSGSISGYYQQLGNIAEHFMYDASFIKLREISLGYRIPQRFLSKMGLVSGSVSVVARNLAILYSNTENVDPESSVSSGNAQGIERLVYPVTRNFGLTIKLGL
ncbi:MAG: SusC/RagA family TonB-linked outer membrane protein [Chitinophagaceae bacterium]|nr:SusC/RagA family TonB-linked outer membrane protein [Chitinophagaceae bacterium]